VGRNDTGKSCILLALDIFFENRKIDDSDFHLACGLDDKVEIAVSFTDLPDTVQLEPGIDTTLAEECLLDSNGHLHVIKRYNRKGKANIFLQVMDYIEPDFQNLCSLKQQDLNKLGDRYELEFSRAGRGITNKSKRMALREVASQKGVPRQECEIEPSKDLYTTLSKLLPGYQLFLADQRLGVEETQFQNQFQSLVESAVIAAEITTEREAIEGKIQVELAKEFEAIHGKLQRYIPSITALIPEPEFAWKKLVRFDVKGEDEYGVSVSLAQRGAGVRRLLMVAFFQHLAEKTATSGNNQHYIFAVEDPEAFLHPGAQRDLAATFQELARMGQQIILTSHSPVFAGAVDVDDLALVQRDGMEATIQQTPALALEEIAQDLGVMPRDQLFGYEACIFVEGANDVVFLESVAEVLRNAGYIEATFADKNIGLIIIGGCKNLRFFVERKALRAIRPTYGVLLDSDRRASHHNIPGRKLHWKTQCEAEGARFYITRKREIENYIHANVIRREFGVEVVVEDYADMSKVLAGIVRKDNIPRLFAMMTAEEILERDRYLDDQGNERHELLEMIQDFLTMC
jgi:hypothetical protein